MALIPLTPEQETEAQRLAERIHEATREDILALARLIVGKRDSDIFGDTEFQARDIVHRVATKALEVHLAEKKRLRGVQRRLPPLPASGRVPGLPGQEPPEPPGSGSLFTRVLRLPSLRPRVLPLG